MRERPRERQVAGWHPEMLNQSRINSLRLLLILMKDNQMPLLFNKLISFLLLAAECFNLSSYMKQILNQETERQKQFNSSESQT